MFNTKNFAKGTRIHCRWFQWDFMHEPQLSVIYTYNNQQYHMKIEKGHQFDFLLTNEKRCVGYPDEHDLLKECIYDNSVKGYQCASCKSKELLSGCVRCKGDYCVNKTAYALCQSTEHVIYLAAYTKDAVKVGTAKRNRIMRRWLEQGTSFASIIAHTKTQKKAKKIESRIAGIGVPDVIFEKKRIESLTNKEGLEEALMQTKEKIGSRFTFPEMDLTHPTVPLYPSLFPRRMELINVKEEVRVQGEITHLQGKHAAIRNNYGFYSLLPLYKLRGAVLKIGLGPKVEQLKLF